MPPSLTAPDTLTEEHLNVDHCPESIETAAMPPSFKLTAPEALTEEHLNVDHRPESIETPATPPNLTAPEALTEERLNMDHRPVSIETPPMPPSFTACEVPTEDQLNVDYPEPRSQFRRNAGINVLQLLEAAAYATNNPITPLPSIRNFAHGSFAKIFLITFHNDVEVIVRAPFPRDYSEQRMSSEIATMLFAREHLDLPVPRLFAWATNSQNPVEAPYLLMERLPGIRVTERMWFMEFPDEKRTVILGHLAKLHARLVKPIPFDHVGNIYLSDLEKIQRRFDSNVSKDRFYVGPFIRNQRFASGREDVATPQKNFPSILDYWKELANLEFEGGRTRWFHKVDPYIVLEEEADNTLNYRPQTTADFADAYRNIEAILGTFRIPAAFSELCLWHNDFAFRNILVDPTTLEFTGLVDWEDVSVVPLVLASRCPNELEQTNKDFRGWVFYPDEWNAFEAKEDDYHGVDCMVATWDRWYYSGQVSLHDHRFTAQLWRGSEQSHKLHELLARGWFFWLERQEWLAETVSGLQL